MENLTYEAYVKDPAVRQAIERAARRAQAEALRRYAFEPLARACGRLLAVRGVRLLLDPRAAAR